MNQPINYGGPAYPTPAGIQHNDGKTLRDYFTAAALQGNLIEPTVSNDEVAKYAYTLADSMLKAREAK